MADYVERFAHRVIQDALAEALPLYWRGRAEQFRAALPQEGDFLGESTEEERAERQKNIEAYIAECERRATTREGFGPEWWMDVLRSVE